MLKKFEHIKNIYEQCSSLGFYFIEKSDIIIFEYPNTNFQLKTSNSTFPNKNSHLFLKTLHTFGFSVSSQIKSQLKEWAYKK
jgi:hypothetical protein